MGDLIDILYYCSAACYEADNPDKPEGATGHAWPGGMETNHDVYCDHCGTLLWRGLESESEVH